MILRHTQMTAFRKAALESFENEMVAHIREFAPRLFEIVGEPGMREFVQMGVDRARQHQFEQRGPVRFYLEMMLTFASDFDTDPQLPWASKALSDKAITDQMARSGALYEAMQKYLDRVAGPNNRFAMEALKRLQRERPEHLQTRPGEFYEK
jgi:hypothetical protein